MWQDKYEMMIRHLVVHDCIDKHRDAVLGQNLGETEVSIWGGRNYDHCLGWKLELQYR